MNFRTPFSRHLFVVTCAHGGCIVCLLFVSAFTSCARHREALVIPDQIVLELPIEPAAVKGVYDEGDAGKTAEKPPENKTPENKTPKLDPNRTELTDTPKPPKPPKPPVKTAKEIDTSGPRIKRVAQSPSDVKPVKKINLTAEEIRKLLEMGAKPSPTAKLSDADLRRALASGMHFSQNGLSLSEDRLCVEVIRKAMYDAWNQPDAPDVEGRTSDVEITFGPGGTVLKTRLARGSGNAAMDASVMQAAGAVRRIDGLPAAFLEQNPTVVITFKLKGDANIGGGRG